LEKLYHSTRLVVLDGDILLPNLGLTEPGLDAIRKNVNIIIHAASSINMIKPLGRLARTIIDPTEMIADFALSCTQMDRFVYVSTAYANAHLYQRSQNTDVKIDEEIYELTHHYHAFDELNELRKHGKSQAYEAENFPWAYAYAKHLTERMLQSRFTEFSSSEKLLIMRPSVIGPAQCLPFPGYNMPMSSPYTMIAAGLALSPSRSLKIATNMRDPTADVTGDEVPVDVVADRLLCHLAMGSHGCVHAVSGVRSRLSFESWRQSLVKIRRFPWELRPRWVRNDWKSSNQHPMSRLYAIFGTSFAFSETKTIHMCRKLPEKELSDLQLFTQMNMSDNLLSRTESIRYVMDQFARQNWLAWVMVGLFYSDFGRTSHITRCVDCDCFLKTDCMS
jgi:hypothetical protein